PRSYVFHFINESRVYYGNFVNVSVSAVPNGDGYYEYSANFGSEENTVWSTVSGEATISRWSRKINYLIIGWFVYSSTYIESLSLESMYTEFEALPSTGALLVARGNTILHTYNADERMAVASTFKLFVLHALVEKINIDPGITWETTYPVQDKYKSLFLGGITNVANGTLLDLKTYADFMINISDNSATDHVINFLGRTFVEGYLPSGYQLPLLTTAEVFKLKYLISDTNLGNYLLMNETDKRTYLDNTIANLDVNDIDPYTDWTHNIDARKQIEWFFNVTEIYDIQKLTIGYSSTQMNWGLAWIGMNWGLVSYKGGSDIGVLAMAHALRATNGTWFYVTFIANNYGRFDFFNYAEYVFGQIGYEAICMKIMFKLSLI
ncbi:MAG TPA: serine hydrolase, partial [Candidatus Deferrimicrobium sp.]|nr:serine hydrolase [Candidatus Deferrimicrobium sp.]